MPQTFSEALFLAAGVQQENELLLLEQEKNQPRVEFAKTIEKSSDSILIREFSKILGNESIQLGEKKLYKWFRENKYINSTSTEPSQMAINKGLFTVQERVIKTVKGNINSLTTKITGKGQVYFLGLLKEERGE